MYFYGLPYQNIINTVIIFMAYPTKISSILWLSNINISLLIFEPNGTWKWWNEVPKVVNVFHGEIWLHWWILKSEGYITTENTNSPVAMQLSKDSSNSTKKSYFPLSEYK